MKQILRTTLFLVLVWTILCGASALADTVKIPEDTKTIEAQAFYGDKRVTRVVLPLGLRAIRSQAFAESGLEQIELPRSVLQIAEDAFAGCPSTLEIIAAPRSFAQAWAVSRGYLPEQPAPEGYDYCEWSSDPAPSQFKKTGKVTFTIHTRDDAKTFCLAFMADAEDDSKAFSMFTINLAAVTDYVDDGSGGRTWTVVSDAAKAFRAPVGQGYLCGFATALAYNDPQRRPDIYAFNYTIPYTMSAK